MGYDLFGNLSVGRNGFGKDIEKEAKKNAQNNLIVEAKMLGINISEYCETNEEGEIVITDKFGLQKAIKEAKIQKENINSTKNDSCVITTQNTNEIVSDEDKVKVANFKDDIEEKLKETEAEYNKLMESKANAEEERLSKSWEEIEKLSLKYVGVQASNTTVLEGAKEFISKICGVANDAQATKTEKESKTELYSDSNKSIDETDNKIHVLGMFAEDNTNILSEKYMNSAFKTFDAEEEERKEFIA